MNVYVCAEAAGAAGYTNYSLPSGAPTPTASSSSTNTSRRQHRNQQLSPQPDLTHECGHWLNLSYTWGSSNNPNEPDNCEVDDGVEDTPSA